MGWSRGGIDKPHVTLSGECFEAEFQGEVPFRLTGPEHRFRLHDVRRGRPDRLVSLFTSDQIKSPNYADRIEFVRINVIRRALDSGKLSFDAPLDQQKYEPLEMRESDFNQQQSSVSDQEIQQYMRHKAYWLSYMHPTVPSFYAVNFENDYDLDYLGTTTGGIRRNVLRLKSQGLLDEVEDGAGRLIGVGRPTAKLIAEYESTMSDARPATHRGLSVFISHSSRDAELALGLIDLLKAGLALTADQIRCSSVDGFRLPVGVNTESKLREEVNAAKVVVGLITPSSLSSSYVMFELGARWGANLFLAPLLAGVKATDLSPPSSLLNALSASNEAQLHQLLADIAGQLALHIQPAASYIRNVATVKALADAVANPPTLRAVNATPVNQKLRVTVSVEGSPPSQTLRVTANRPVEVLRVDYMLSNETTVASEDVSREGDSVEIPVNDSLLLEVWNTPRHDRHFYDHSGPAKIGITVSVDGEPRQYILPVQMQTMMQDTIVHRQLVGSKNFYS